MMVELRCPNGIKFGELFDDDKIIEVKCRSARCGAEPGVVVLHGFDAETGKFVGTQRFREVAPSIEGGLNASEHDPHSVRSA